MRSIRSTAGSLARRRFQYHSSTAELIRLSNRWYPPGAFDAKSQWLTDAPARRDRRSCAEAKRLLEWLKEREPLFEASLQNISEEFKSEPTEDVISYFRMKYLWLKVFLRMAIKLNETITWSV